MPVKRPAPSGASEQSERVISNELKRVSMDDAKKIEILKQAGVWDSIREHRHCDLEVHSTSYDCWFEGGEKVSHITFEYKPATVLRDSERHTSFMMAVFECLDQALADATPDLPEKLWNSDEDIGDGA